MNHVRVAMAQQCQDTDKETFLISPLAETQARVKSEGSHTLTNHDKLWTSYGEDVLKSKFERMEPIGECKESREIKNLFLKWSRKWAASISQLVCGFREIGYEGIEDELDNE